MCKRHLGCSTWKRIVGKIRVVNVEVEMIITKWKLNPVLFADAHVLAKTVDYLVMYSI